MRVGENSFQQGMEGVGRKSETRETAFGLHLEGSVKVCTQGVGDGEQRHRGWEMSNVSDVVEGRMLKRQGGTRICLVVSEFMGCVKQAGKA